MIGYNFVGNQLKITTVIKSRRLITYVGRVEAARDGGPPYGCCCIRLRGLSAA
jgi:hypothetical protein